MNSRLAPTEIPTPLRKPQAQLFVHQTRWLDSENFRSLWVQTIGLRSANGYRQTSSVMAILSQKSQNGGIEHTTLRNSFDFSELKPGPSVGECHFSRESHAGSLQLKGKNLSWQFKILSNEDPSPLPFYSNRFTQIGWMKAELKSLRPTIRAEGWVESNGIKSDWKNCTGYEIETTGARGPLQRFFLQANTLWDEAGQVTDAWIEGVSLRDHLPLRISSPWLNSFRISYRGKIYGFNKIWHSIRSRTERQLNEWIFQLDDGDLSFRGVVKCTNKDFLGLTFEDTDEKIHHVSFSPMANFDLWVYRGAKIEARLNARNTAVFEVLSQDKNPYLTASI